MRQWTLVLSLLGAEVLALRLNPDEEAEEPPREVDTGSAVIEHGGPQRLGFHVPTTAADQT